MDNRFGRLIVDIEEKDLSNEDIDIIRDQNVGGIILFSRNFESKYQIQKLINKIKKIKDNILIAVDHEGGRVQRFTNEFTSIPPMQKIANYVKENKDVSFLKDVGWLMSSELISVGVDINFAPVLDIDKSTSSIIGDRSFSDDCDDVVKYASSLIDGIHEAGMKSTGKHFPGHGGIYEDSHIELPLDNRSLKELIDNDIKPYRKLINKLDAIMCAHVLFPKIENKIPCYSIFWLQRFLRKNLSFNGIIISDDLSMMGAGNDPCSLKALKSLNAGCDIIIICNNREEVKKTLHTLNKNKISASKNVSIMKAKNYVDWDELNRNQRSENIKEKIKSITYTK